MGSPQRWLWAVALVLAGAADARAQTDLLPDLTIAPQYLNDTLITSLEPGRLHLLLANVTPNIGDGKFWILPDETKSTGKYGEDFDYAESLLQRIFRSDESFYDVPAGNCEHDPSIGLIHVQRWAEFRLRTLLPNNGVGPVVATGEKTSFCLVDSLIFDGSLPGFNPSERSVQCHNGFMAITVGYADFYSKFLPGQSIDITDIEPGTYWLEAEVNPDGRYVEKNHDNNVGRAKVYISGAYFPETLPIHTGATGLVAGILLGVGVYALMRARPRRNEA